MAFRDTRGVEIKLGDTVARAVVYGHTPSIRIQLVTRIENGKVFLDHSNQPIRNSDAVIVITTGINLLDGDATDDTM